MGYSVEILVTLIQMVCVIVVAAQVVTAIPVFRQALTMQPTGKQILAFAIFFGLLAVFGSYSGFEVLGAKINIRDLGPMIAGLIAGPYAGLGAGLIGGLHRYSLGSITAIPCTAATILAGLLGGIVNLKYHRRFCGVQTAVLLAVGVECLHMLLILAFVRPVSVGLEIVSSLAVPMITANAVGMAAFSVIIADYIKRQENGGGDESSSLPPEGSG